MRQLDCKGWGWGFCNELYMVAGVGERVLLKGRSERRRFFPCLSDQITSATSTQTTQPLILYSLPEGETSE